MSDPCDGADYKVLWQQMQGRAEAAEAELAAAREQVRVLREALKRIAAGVHLCTIDLQVIARAALRGEGEK